MTPQRRRQIITEVHQHLPRSACQVTLPDKLNAPAFLVLPQGRLRILVRTVCPGTRTFKFVFDHVPAADDLGCVLLCVDPSSQQVHVLFTPAGTSGAYRQITLEEARGRPGLIFPLAA